MALSNSQKHHLLTQFNNQRERVHEDYQEGKQLRKTMAASGAGPGQQQTMCSEDQIDPMTGELRPQYNKLYKQLGQNNRNKEVRQEMHGKLNATVESALSPTMWLQLNPRFYMEEQMVKSHAMETF